MKLRRTLLYMTAEPAPGGITGIQAQALREMQKVCQAAGEAMPSAAQGHCSTHIEPTAISLGLINLFQHHIHHLGRDLGAEGLVTHASARGLVGHWGPASTLQFAFSKRVKNRGGPERLSC